MRAMVRTHGLGDSLFTIVIEKALGAIRKWADESGRALEPDAIRQSSLLRESGIYKHRRLTDEGLPVGGFDLVMRQKA
jgi:hypothetical protein